MAEGPNRSLPYREACAKAEAEGKPGMSAAEKKALEICGALYFDLILKYSEFRVVEATGELGRPAKTDRAVFENADGYRITVEPSGRFSFQPKGGVVGHGSGFIDLWTVLGPEGRAH